MKGLYDFIDLMRNYLSQINTQREYPCCDVFEIDIHNGNQEKAHKVSFSIQTISNELLAIIYSFMYLLIYVLFVDVPFSDIKKKRSTHFFA